MGCRNGCQHQLISNHSCHSGSIVNLKKLTCTQIKVWMNEVWICVICTFLTLFPTIMKLSDQENIFSKITNTKRCFITHVSVRKLAEMTGAQCVFSLMKFKQSQGELIYLVSICLIFYFKNKINWMFFFLPLLLSNFLTHSIIY